MDRRATGGNALTPIAAWALALAATSTMAVSYVDRQALSVLAPTITKQLHISETAFGWLGSSFSIAYLLFAPLAGRWIDRVGARSGLLAAVLVWSLVAALHALAPGFEVLLLLRVLLGVAESPSFPAAAQTVTRALPPVWRNVGFGVLFTGSSLGAAIAAVLLPWLEHRYGWRTALVATAIVGLAWVPMWLAVTGSALARATLAVVPEDGRAEAFDWRALVSDPAVFRAVLAVVAAAPVTGFVLLWGAKLLVAQHGLEQADVGRYLWLPPLVFDLGAVLFGVLASLRVRRGATSAPLALFAVASLLLVAVGRLGFGADPWTTTITCAVAMAGGGGVYTLCTGDMLARVHPSRVAAASSLASSAQSIALIVAFPIVGAVLDRTHSYVPVGIGLAVWALPGLVAWLVIKPGEPRGT